MKALKLIAAATFLFLSHSAMAVVLWDQPPDPDDPAFIDQEFSDFPNSSTYLVDDVFFGSSVTINSVTTYFTNGSSLWPTGTDSASAVLNIFDGDALNAGDDPTGGGDFGLASVLVDIIVTADGLEITADGLSISLAAGGLYWFGLTPILDFGTFSQEFHQETLFPFNEHAQGRNPGGDFGIGTDWFDAGQTFGGINWDMALTIGGEIAAVPEPGTFALLMLGLVGMGFARGRRKV